MTRHGGGGLWIAFLLLLTAAAVCYILIPLSSCPWCIGAVKELPAATGLPVHCPICFDRGKVSLMRSRNAGILHPALADLIRTQRSQTQIDSVPTIASLAKERGLDVSAVIGSKYFTSRGFSGRVRFIRAEGRDFILVLSYGIDDARFR